MARPTRSGARYVFRQDEPEKNRLNGLNWLASRSKKLSHEDGSPHLTNIAANAGLDKGTLSTLASCQADLGMGSMAALTRLAMSTGASRRMAEERLYTLVYETNDQAVAA